MTSYVPSVMSPLSEQTFDRQIDRVLDEALRAFGTSTTTQWVPACNVWDDANGFYVQVALPGWEASRITLEIDNQILTVKGEWTEDERGEGTRYHLEEIGGGRFVRMFKLPSFVDYEKASAMHKNGMLTISFPKREEAKCRRILIAAD